MTIPTHTAETGSGVQGLAPAAGLPDELDIARWANAFFQSFPGLDGFGRGPSAQGADSGISGAREAAQLGPLTPAPVSVGGAGFSPTGLNPESFHLTLPHAAEHSGAATVPGVGLPPSGVSSFGPAAPVTPPSSAGSGFGLSPQGVPTHPQGVPFSPSLAQGVPNVTGDAARLPGSDLYIFAEAQSRREQQGFQPSSDRTAARPDLLPGQDDLTTLFQSFASDPVNDKGSDHSFVQSAGHPIYDVEAIRRDFPILKDKVHGRPLVWLDNGATTQKPQAVIDRLAYYYAHENSNVHRAAHTLAARSTDAYENARKIVARFLGASDPEEIVFVRGATEAINLVAQSWGRQNIGAGDEIVVSHLEHHANIVPWQMLAAEKGAKLRVIPVDDDGQIILSEYQKLLNDRTKIVAVTHVSNALGTIVPVKDVVDLAHAAGAKVLIDGAQSVAHLRANVQALDTDFYVFSGHKIFAPTGIGALYGKKAILNATQPWQGGGNMIADVTFEKTQYQPAPARFEAGTGNLADAVGLGAALDYIERIGLENIARHEHDLLVYATAGLKTVPGLKLFGSAKDKASVLSFTLEGFEPVEVGRALDQYGIAVRAGHHCAQPILRRFGVEGTVRASLALYNNQADVDCLVTALKQIAASRGK